MCRLLTLAQTFQPNQRAVRRLFPAQEVFLRVQQNVWHLTGSSLFQQSCVPKTLVPPIGQQRSRQVNYSWICKNCSCKNDGGGGVSSSSSVCSPIIPVTVVDVIPAAPQRLLSPEQKDYSPGTCAEDGCDLPVYKPGNNPPPACACLCISSCMCLLTITALVPPQIMTMILPALRCRFLSRNPGMGVEVLSTTPATSTGPPRSHRRMSGVEHEHQFIYQCILRIINKRFRPALRCWNV